jgi:hypothetical protein
LASLLLLPLEMFQLVLLTGLLVVTDVHDEHVLVEVFLFQVFPILRIQLWWYIHNHLHSYQLLVQVTLFVADTAVQQTFHANSGILHSNLGWRGEDKGVVSAFEAVGADVDVAFNSAFSNESITVASPNNSFRNKILVNIAETMMTGRFERNEIILAKFITWARVLWCAHTRRLFVFVMTDIEQFFARFENEVANTSQIRADCEKFVEFHVEKVCGLSRRWWN